MAAEPMSERLVGIVVRAVLSVLLLIFYIWILGVNIETPEMKFFTVVAFALMTKE